MKNLTKTLSIIAVLAAFLAISSCESEKEEITPTEMNSQEKLLMCYGNDEDEDERPGGN